MSPNAEKYHFSDFTTENYRRLLHLAKKNYSFKNFSNYSSSENFILWRHDVDFSMHRALKLAEIEASEGIQATYFILLHCEYYNVLEKEVSSKIEKIIGLGHAIGLHFDSHYYGITTEDQLEDKLLFEKNILEKVFGVTINAFSFHATNDFTMNCRKERYADLVNVYASKFQTEIAYCSDTNGYWRFKRLEDVLVEKKNDKLQVLTHPEVWQDEVMSPKQRVRRCIEGRAEKAKQLYDDFLKKNNRDNIDW